MTVIRTEATSYRSFQTDHIVWAMEKLEVKKIGTQNFNEKYNFEANQ